MQAAIIISAIIAATTNIIVVAHPSSSFKESLELMNATTGITKTTTKINNIDRNIVGLCMVR